MSIEYTYEIVSADAQARCMEILYTAAGYPQQRISARLPYEGESLEAVVAMYSPVRYWEELNAAVSVPEVGISGTMTPVVPEESPSVPMESPQGQANQKMMERIQFEKEVANLLVKWGVLQNDPTAIEVTQL